jgi:hypothetical protein
MNSIKNYFIIENGQTWSHVHWFARLRGKMLKFMETYSRKRKKVNSASLELTSDD